MNSDSSAVEPARERGWLGILADLYFAPAEGFAALVRRPRFWAALAVMMALGVGVAAIWLQKVDRAEFVKQQLEEFGAWDKMPPEARAQALEARGFDVQVWIGSVMATPVFVMAAAGVYLFLFRFFLGSEVGFRQSLAIVIFTFLAVGLVRYPLSLLVLALKGDWNIPVEYALQASLALFLDKSTTAKPLFAFLDSLDLLSFWTLYLLAAGYRAAGGHRLGTALVTVAVPWMLWVLGKVGVSFLF